MTTQPSAAARDTHPLLAKYRSMSVDDLSEALFAKEMEVRRLRERLGLFTQPTTDEIVAALSSLTPEQRKVVDWIGAASAEAWRNKANEIERLMGSIVAALRNLKRATK